MLDKPAGPTSHQVDSWVRDILGVEKVGHVGTLDPGATGVLVMAIGRALRLVDVVHELPKEYVCAMRFHSDVPASRIEEKISEFTGEIYQIPPIRSAVARNLRVRTIYGYSNVEIDGRSVLFRVKCESGTYIRSLCTDIGYACGTMAQMQDLRRLSTGPFSETEMITLQQLSDYELMRQKGDQSYLEKCFIPMEKFFSDYPKIIVKTSAIANISHGSDLYPGGIKAVVGNPRKGDRVCVISENNDILGTGRMLVSASEIDTLKVVDFDRVLIDPVISATSVERDVRDESKVVRPGKGSKEISFQKSGKQLRGDIRKTEERRNSGNRAGRDRRNTRREGNAPPVWKRKNKRKPHR